MNKVTITISGPTNSGKTTLASAIEDFLSRRGFMDTEINDVNMQMHRSVHLDETIMAQVAPNTKLVINVVQSSKTV
jgi:hypothetical protein